VMRRKLLAVVKMLLIPERLKCIDSSDIMSSLATEILRFSYSISLMVRMVIFGVLHVSSVVQPISFGESLNPLNAELNPMCYLLVLRSSTYATHSTLKPVPTLPR
jgi:hypothetical protein